jgi:hypothetical protein
MITIMMMVMMMQEHEVQSPDEIFLILTHYSKFCSYVVTCFLDDGWKKIWALWQD